MKKIFIITVNFNSEKETIKCLDSLDKLLTKHFLIEIVVVDNGSENKMDISGKKRKYPVNLLRIEKNLGFTGGNNTGIEFALKRSADYIMLLNNDTQVDKNLLINFFSFAEKNHNAGLIGPKIYFAKGYEFHIDRYKENELGHVFWYAGGGIDFANVMSFHRGVDEVDIGQYDKTEETEFVSGCCMFLRADILQNIGEFDNKYFLYFEDADLSLRIKMGKFKIYYLPCAYLWHETAASSGGSGSSLHDYFLTRNRLIFGMKYAPFRSKIALIRESLRLILNGREWQKRGIVDFFLKRFGRGRFPI